MRVRTCSKPRLIRYYDSIGLIGIHQKLNGTRQKLIGTHQNLNGKYQKLFGTHKLIGTLLKSQGLVCWHNTRSHLAGIELV